MFIQNLLALLAIALSVSSLPTHSYPSTDDLIDTNNKLNLTASVYPTPTRILTDLPTSTPTPTGRPVSASPSRSPTSSPPRSPSPRPSSSSITNSGNDGTGSQSVGNTGQSPSNTASNSGTIDDDYTVSQASQTCGNAQLNCCNKISKKGDTNNAGLLGAVFGSGDLGVQCSPINIPVIGVQVPINKACDAKAACCQGDTVQNGLVNVGCIALASLV